MMNESKLIEKLRLIEAMYTGATTVGERVAAERARERILERLKFWEKEDPPVEYRFSMGNMWSRKVFVALLRRYGIQPYRYKRQRHTTVMAKVSKKFVDETLWPEFNKFDDTLETYLSDVTNRVISQVIHKDSSEADVVDEPPQLPSSTVPLPEDLTKTSQSNAPEIQIQKKQKKKKRRKKKRKRR